MTCNDCIDSVNPIANLISYLLHCRLFVIGYYKYLYIRIYPVFPVLNLNFTLYCVLCKCSGICKPFCDSTTSRNMNLIFH